MFQLCFKTCVQNGSSPGSLRTRGRFSNCFSSLVLSGVFCFSRPGRMRTALRPIESKFQNMFDWPSCCSSAHMPIAPILFWHFKRRAWTSAIMFKAYSGTTASVTSGSPLAAALVLPPYQCRTTVSSSICQAPRGGSGAPGGNGVGAAGESTITFATALCLTMSCWIWRNMLCC